MKPEVTITEIAGKYKIQLSIGVQGFLLAYAPEEKEDAEWMKKSLEEALAKIAN